MGQMNDGTIKRKKAAVRNLRKYMDTHVLNTKVTSELLEVTPECITGWLRGKSLPGGPREDKIRILTSSDPVKRTTTVDEADPMLKLLITSMTPNELCVLIREASEELMNKFR